MMTDLAEEKGLDFYLQKHLDNPQTVDAPTWLAGGTADQPRTICPGMSNEVAKDFVDELIEKGAEHVWLGVPQGDPDANLRDLLLIELSSDPVRRQRIFDFKDFDAILHCGSSELDEGQTHTFHVLHHHECDCGNELEEED